MRLLKKIPFVFYKLLKKQNYLQTNKKVTIIKTWSRSSVILPCMTKRIFSIYNGQKHIPLLITEQIIGFKLGEFSLTKKFFSHIKTEKKIQHLKK
jgi:small subunit ribosomal protein S19